MLVHIYRENMYGLRTNDICLFVQQRSTIKWECWWDKVRELLWNIYAKWDILFMIILSKLYIVFCLFFDSLLFLCCWQIKGKNKTFYSLFFLMHASIAFHVEDSAWQTIKCRNILNQLKDLYMYFNCLETIVHLLYIISSLHGFQCHKKIELHIWHLRWNCEIMFILDLTMQLWYDVIAILLNYLCIIFFVCCK